jgi:hypothetical protein
MEKHLKNDIPIILDAEQLYHDLRKNRDATDQDYLVFSHMAEEAKRVARPQFIFGAASVEKKGIDAVLIEGHLVRARLVRQNLEAVHRVFPYVATCGMEIEKWSNQFTDFVERYWAEAIKNHVLDQCIQVMREAIKKQYRISEPLAQMNPGSIPQWPLTGQRLIFDLFSGELKKMKVSLTESFLMIPSKSVSGFYFLSEHGFENCQLCPILRCPNRRAPFKNNGKTMDGTC